MNTKIEDTIVRILTMKPIYIKKGLPKEAEEKLSLVHKRDCLIELFEETLQSAHLKWNKEMREMIEEVSNHPIEVVGNSALAFNQFRKELLKQLEENL
jgi:hypothetical protein